MLPVMIKNYLPQEREEGTILNLFETLSSLLCDLKLNVTSMKNVHMKTM